MNILPVPGSMSLPQKEQDRRTGMGSPHGEFARLPCRLPKHEGVPDLDGAPHVACDDSPLVAAVEDAHLDLRRLAGHARPADGLHGPRGAPSPAMTTNCASPRSTSFVTSFVPLRSLPLSRTSSTA